MFHVVVPVNGSYAERAASFGGALGEAKAEEYIRQAKTRGAVGPFAIIERKGGGTKEGFRYTS